MKRKKKAKNPKITLKEYLQFALAMGVILGSLFLFVRHLTVKKIEEINEINKNPGFTKGFITETRRNNGRWIEVRYSVKGVVFECHESVPDDSDKQEGDSVGIKYSIRNPQYSITELHRKY